LRATKISLKKVVGIEGLLLRSPALVCYDLFVGGCHTVAGNHRGNHEWEAMIGLREIRALGPDRIIWDTGKGAVAGFGARRRSGDAVTYILKYRAGGSRRGRQRWYVIGRHGSPWTPEEARREAKSILGAVADGRTRPPNATQRGRRKPSPSCAICTWPMSRLAGC